MLNNFNLLFALDCFYFFLFIGIFGLIVFYSIKNRKFYFNSLNFDGLEEQVNNAVRVWDTEQSYGRDYWI
jgi:hypothetical protein